MSILAKLKRRIFCNSSEMRFIQYNKKKQKPTKQSTKNNKVILIDRFDNPLVTYRYSNVARYLSEQTGAKIEYFQFSRTKLDRIGLPLFRLNSIYKSFGASEGLSFKNAKPFESQANKLADETFNGLKTKQDLVNITFKNIHIGDLIYDTYLRTGKATVDLQDKLLLDIIIDAYRIFFACEDYLSKKEVVAVFPSHPVYIQFGILTRIAGERGIPIFVPRIYDDHLFSLNKDLAYQRYPYFNYREIFSKLSAEEQERGKAIGRSILVDRLKGKIDAGIADMAEKGRSGLSGYGRMSNQRILNTNTKPKILIMLHCFFDAPHGYRNMLFPDFWEWIVFTLDRAKKTNFDWYVKPHPAGLPKNAQVVEELIRKYPEITFLDPKSSNDQLIAEGISALFTVHGTGGNEFAYLGLPVVNAGDNPHIAYNFNLHPKTIEEYAAHIDNADNLKLDIDKGDIEAYVYMHYRYFQDQFEQLSDSGFEKHVRLNLANDTESTAIYDYVIDTASDERDKKQRDYFKNYFGSNGKKIIS